MSKKYHFSGQIFVHYECCRRYLSNKAPTIFQQGRPKKPKQGITNFEFININQSTIYLFKTLKDNDAAVVDISANKAAAFVNYQGIHALEYDIIALLL